MARLTKFWIFGLLLFGCGDSSPELDAKNTAVTAKLFVSDCPAGAREIYVSKDTEPSCVGRNGSRACPLRTLNEAQLIIDAAESTADPEPSSAAYCVLLRGGERFEPNVATALDFNRGQPWDSRVYMSCSKCRGERQVNRNRFAFVYRYNKPFTLTSFGPGRAIIAGADVYDPTPEACCDPCGTCTTTHLSARVQFAVAINAWWNENASGLNSVNQRTVISDIMFTDWSMGAIYAFKTRDITL